MSTPHNPSQKSRGTKSIPQSTPTPLYNLRLHDRSLFEAPGPSAYDLFKEAALDANRQQMQSMLDRGVGSVDQNEALLWVAQHGLATAVNILLEHGANVNAKSQSGITALHLACKHGKSVVMSLLLEAGCNVNAQDLQGKTPIDYVPLEDLERYQTLNFLLRQYGARKGSHVRMFEITPAKRIVEKESKGKERRTLSYHEKVPKSYAFSTDEAGGTFRKARRMLSSKK